MLECVPEGLVMADYENSPEDEPKIARWFWPVAAVVVLLSGLAGLVLMVAQAFAADFSGRVSHVADGDTFRIGSVSVRLCGINAPERGEAGYRQATVALERIVAGKIVRCIPVGSGSICDGRSRPVNGGRVVAQCFVGKNDIAADLVRQGAACDWPRFSGGHYSRNGGCRR